MKSPGLGYGGNVHRSDEPQAPEYVLAHLKEALASDERVNALDIEVRMHGDEVVLLGTVDTADRRDAADAVAHAVLPTHEIVNELRVQTLGGEVESEPSVAVRVAAVGDIHLGVGSAGSFRPHLERLAESADLLLLAGDLTRHGDRAEGAVLASELRGLGVPVVAVLGNHDHHSDQSVQITEVLQEAGVRVLEKSSCVIEVRDLTVGVAGVKGFAGGFAGVSCSDFGEPVVKDFVREAREAALGLERELRALDTDIRLALMHYSPIEDTLRGEKPEIFPWLGSYMLGEALDLAECDFAFHGHAHAGTEVGQTAGGIPVRNVASPVIGSAYKVYCIEPTRTFANVSALGGMAG